LLDELVEKTKKPSKIATLNAPSTFDFHQD